MLFRNLKSGNMIAAADETSIWLMQRSAIYEAVEAAPGAESEKAEGKRRKKAAQAEPDTADVQGD